jgi:hypothetical protein
MINIEVTKLANGAREITGGEPIHAANIFDAL